TSFSRDWSSDVCSSDLNFVGCFNISPFLSSFHFSELSLPKSTLFTLVHNPPNFTPYTVTHVQRTIRTHSQSDRACMCITVIDYCIQLCETIGKHFPRSTGYASFKAYKRY